MIFYDFSFHWKIISEVQNRFISVIFLITEKYYDYFIKELIYIS